MAKKKTAAKKTLAKKKAAPRKKALKRAPAKKKTAAKSAPVKRKAFRKPKKIRHDGGLFVSFEGSEGSGKSTQISMIAERFEDAGCDVIVTREPGGTEIGEEIRHLLMHASSGDNMTPEAELLLFAASRAQLVREVILPSLEDGKVVLCDRFLDSTTVYQGVGRKISAEPVHIINNFAVGSLMPDITIILDCPAELGLERIKHRVNAMPDRMERENIEFYKLVREGYLLLAQAMPERFIVADSTLPRDDVEKRIWSEIVRRIG